MAHHACCPDRVTSVHLFRLARVVCRHVLKLSPCFEENAVYSTKLIYILCSYISWPLQDLNKALSSFLIASFEEFLCTCRRDEVVGESSCVVPAAFLLLHRSVFSTIQPPFNFTLSSNTACMSTRRN